MKIFIVILLSLAVWAILLIGPIGPPLAGAQTIERAGGVTFSNIAPGELEDELVKAMPLKVVFASESGVLYSGVYIRIFNESGVPVFKRLCEKPWLFVKLPAGEYNIVAVDRKKVQRAAPLRVRQEGDRQTVVKLTWPKKVVGY